jgi:hypothetical protein
MSERFFITGLPRSRTGYLANLFTYGPSFCLHDAAAAMKNAQETVNRLSERHPEIGYWGISDSSIPIIPGFAIPKGARIIVVLRPIPEVVESAAEYFVRHPYGGNKPEPGWYGKLKESVEVANTKLQTFFEAHPGQTRLVQYENLDDMNVLRQLWHFIIPDEPFFDVRAQALSRLRVNPASEKINGIWDLEF